MSKLFLSRARLRRDAGTAALAPLLLPEGRMVPDVGKALVWSLFAGGEGARDFLWRWDKPAGRRLGGEFLILSARPPHDGHNLFTLEVKAFEPDFAPGDRLAFRLRANPVVRRRSDGEASASRHDVVMDAIHGLPRGERAEPRRAAISQAGRRWIETRVARAGARLLEQGLRVDGYEKHEVPRKGEGAITFSTLDFDGVLDVIEPERFLLAVRKGFGAQKAYGCGLMLIRRA